MLKNTNFKKIGCQRKGTPPLACFKAGGRNTASGNSTKSTKMKTSRFLSGTLVAAIAAASLFSCESNNDVRSSEDILPESFSVEIPRAISHDGTSGGRIDGRTADDSISGDEVYKHLGTFIAVGKGASRLVEEFIHGIRRHHINRVMTLTFVSDDDNRIKNLVVSSNVEFEGQTWDYSLTVTDADSESQPDGGKALQLFWNRNATVTGIAIIKPYNCDRAENEGAPDAMFRVDYSEEGSADYDRYMKVQVAGLPPGEDQYSMSTLQMFVGKKDNIIDVFGNSNHPNAILFSGEAGFNWAFVASSDRALNIGVAEVGLPPSNTDSDDREVLLGQYSIKNVFTNAILEAWPGLDPALLDAYLSNIKAPGYFSEGGFVSGGESPGEDWDVLAARLENLSPYNPYEVSNLELSFR